ncbi:hypothetical protein SAMN04487914_104182 [Arthrobacter sp. ok909]|jgi:hypothetical protein|uniref:hypothetical protein n=1 Tax=Arthrobacter sp. ok909 TaxID=1761746 RepID=UPI00088428A7|nr:hypothetical protein [Arthrobacter sp. ok909]SDP16519.1 hypothetical protein SAMN04487914_104182 [Arthrobacter sp. ok909]
MNTTSRRIRKASGLPAGAGGARDFVAVDDIGDFSYHRSEEDLIAAFEYVGEAACVIDRSGGSYRLVLDANRHLVLGQVLGPVEFRWLRHAWLGAQNAHPDEHRLRRFYPVTSDEVVSDLFETLALERGREPAESAWSVDIEGFASRPSSLKEIDRMLARQKPLEHVRVKDPFGHIYRPARHRSHWYLPASAGAILYVEVPAPVTTH